MDDLELCLYDLESFQTILKVSGRSKKCPDHPENVAGLSKILQNHLLCAFFADLIYVLYPESFCDKNLAVRKVFVFSDSGRKIVGKKREERKGVIPGRGDNGNDKEKNVKDEMQSEAEKVEKL